MDRDTLILRDHPALRVEQRAGEVLAVREAGRVRLRRREEGRLVRQVHCAREERLAEDCGPRSVWDGPQEKRLVGHKRNYLTSLPALGWSTQRNTKAPEPGDRPNGCELYSLLP